MRYHYGIGSGSGRKPWTARLALWVGALGIVLAACGTTATPTPPPTTSGPTGAPATTLALRVPARQGESALTEERTLALPEGFQIAVYAAGMGKARFMAWSPEGALVISEMLPSDGRVLIWPDRDRDGVAEERVVFAQGLRNPHGLAVRDGYLYVAEERQVVRFPWQGGRTPRGRFAEVTDLPLARSPRGRSGSLDSSPGGRASLRTRPLPSILIML